MGVRNQGCGLSWKLYVSIEYNQVHSQLQQCLSSHCSLEIGRKWEMFTRYKLGKWNELGYQGEVQLRHTVSAGSQAGVSIVIPIFSNPIHPCEPCYQGPQGCHFTGESRIVFHFEKRKQRQKQFKWCFWCYKVIRQQWFLELILLRVLGSGVHKIRL